MVMSTRNSKLYICMFS